MSNGSRKQKKAHSQSLRTLGRHSKMRFRVEIQSIRHWKLKVESWKLIETRRLRLENQIAWLASILVYKNSLYTHLKFSAKNRLLAWLVFFFFFISFRLVRSKFHNLIENIAEVEENDCSFLGTDRNWISFGLSHVSKTWRFHKVPRGHATGSAIAVFNK